MAILKNNQILISSAIVHRKSGNGKGVWLLIRQSKEDNWEFPKSTVRKGESSVRTAIRIMAEQGGMNTRVIEEAGRHGGSATINGKQVTRRYIYYMMILRAGGDEAIGFPEVAWFDYTKALKTLPSKNEKEMLKNAKKEFDKWKKERKKKV